MALANQGRRRHDDTTKAPTQLRTSATKRRKKKSTQSKEVIKYKQQVGVEKEVATERSEETIGSEKDRKRGQR